MWLAEYPLVSIERTPLIRTSYAEPVRTSTTKRWTSSQRLLKNLGMRPRPRSRRMWPLPSSMMRRKSSRPRLQKSRQRAGDEKTAAELAEYYKLWLAKHPLVSIEDLFDQDDWDAYSPFTKEVGGDVQIVGEDLLVTNPNRIQKSFDVGACSAPLYSFVSQLASSPFSNQCFKTERESGRLTQNQSKFPKHKQEQLFSPMKILKRFA